ncbi:MAG: histidine phosphatase family protein [Lachnospiraceae bacterium]|nr:histidine phosphatase family protein [Lachnospiraceae bacterium]
MRHGITDWNQAHKLQGKTDIPLNDEGRKMAAAAAEEYKDLHIDICFCSPLKRAYETATILLDGRNIPIKTDERLSEMCFGDYEGLAYSFQIPDCPINVIFQKPEEYKASIGGSETFEELFDRTGSFLREVVEPLLKDGKDVLIVAHGALNSCIITQRKHLQIKDFWSNGIPQCKIMEL